MVTSKSSPCFTLDSRLKQSVLIFFMIGDWSFCVAFLFVFQLQGFDFHTEHYEQITIQTDKPHHWNNIIYVYSLTSVHKSIIRSIIRSPIVSPISPSIPFLWPSDWGYITFAIVWMAGNYGILNYIVEDSFVSSFSSDSCNFPAWASIMLTYCSVREHISCLLDCSMRANIL